MSLGGIVTLAVEEWWKGGEHAELPIVSAAATEVGMEVVSTCDFGVTTGRRCLVCARRSRLGFTVLSSWA
jgi:hypothetical protein